MNQIISIKEGNITRILAPIDKLKVNTTDNKVSAWVSAGKANTGVLHASENGIYIASEDGYESYSEVIVRVTKDSYEGDTSFDDWDYETPDMDLSNWDPETIEDFELDPDGFNDIFNNEDEWKDIDKPIGIKMDNPKIQDTKISGIDPVTGNEMEVGLDEDGYLTESTLPSSIKIVVPPDKHQYVDGQPILFRGMIVKAYTADGELWTDENHSDGVIPHSELTFPITTAEGYGEETKSYDIDPNVLANKTGYQLPLISSGSVGYDEGWITCKVTAPATIVIVNYSIYAFAESPFTMVLEQELTSTHKKSYYYYDSVPTTTLVSHKTVYYASGINVESILHNGGTVSGYLNFVNEGRVYIRDIATILFDGIETYGFKTNIPVQYIRSDGEVLEDSFTIEVLPDPDGAHPQVDPSTVEWNHRRYKANEDLGAVEVRHGSVYMEGGAIYDVGAAVRLGMLEPVDNEIVP